MKLPERRRLVLGGGLAALTASVAGFALAGHNPAQAATPSNVHAVTAASVTAATSEPDTPEAAETPAATEAPGAPETASDGPGGHADNPADANANHDFNGQE